VKDHHVGCLERRRVPGPLLVYQTEMWFLQDRSRNEVIWSKHSEFEGRERTRIGRLSTEGDLGGLTVSRRYELDSTIFQYEEIAKPLQRQKSAARRWMISIRAHESCQKIPPPCYGSQCPQGSFPSEIRRFSRANRCGPFEGLITMTRDCHHAERDGRNDGGSLCFLIPSTLMLVE